MKSTLRGREHVVYIAYASEGTCLYVGMTSDFAARKSAHMAQSPWARFTDRWETMPVKGRREALALERITIREREPLFNVKKNAMPVDDPYRVMFARLQASRPVILRTDLEAWLTS